MYRLPSLATHLVDAHDVRVFYLSSGACLAKKLLGFCVVELAGAGNLDRDRSVKFGVPCFPDAAKLSGPDLGEKLEVSNTLCLLAVRRRGVPTHEMKLTPTGRAFDVTERVVVHKLNRVVAVGTADRIWVTSGIADLLLT